MNAIYIYTFAFVSCSCPLSIQFVRRSTLDARRSTSRVSSLWRTKHNITHHPHHTRALGLQVCTRGRHVLCFLVPGVKSGARESRARCPNELCGDLFEKRSQQTVGSKPASRSLFAITKQEANPQSLRNSTCPLFGTTTSFQLPCHSPSTRRNAFPMRYTKPERKRRKNNTRSWSITVSSTPLTSRSLHSRATVLESSCTWAEDSLPWP